MISIAPFAQLHFRTIRYPYASYRQKAVIPLRSTYTESDPMMLVRLLLFLSFLVCIGVNLYLSEQLIDEVERDMAMNERPSLKLLINGNAYFWRAIRQHRLLYPSSRLRRKVIILTVLTILNLLSFFASFPWSIS